MNRDRISDADVLSEDWMPCTAEEVRRKFINRERRAVQSEHR
jgi:hypothetical protein